MRLRRHRTPSAHIDRRWHRHDTLAIMDGIGEGQDRGYVLCSCGCNGVLPWRVARDGAVEIGAWDRTRPLMQ